MLAMATSPEDRHSFQSTRRDPRCQLPEPASLGWSDGPVRSTTHIRNYRNQVPRASSGTRSVVSRRTLQCGNSYGGVRRPAPGYKVAASGDVLPQIAQIARGTRGIEVEPVPVHPTTRNGASPWALPRRRAGQRRSTVRSVRPRKRVRCSALRPSSTCGAAPAGRSGASLIADSHRLGGVVRMVSAG